MAANERAGGKSKARAPRKRTNGINERLVKSLTHGLRVEILTILNERIASPNELAKELGEGLSQVSYHVKVLKDYKCIELVKTEPRRGAVEHYYRATSRAFLSDRDWAALPASVRPGLSADLLKLILSDAGTALEEETFDNREDRHMSRTLMLLDEEGWQELMGTLEQTLNQVGAIQKRASSRLAKSGEEGINVSAALLGFEIPEAPSKRGRAGKKKPRAKTPRKAKAKAA